MNDVIQGSLEWRAIRCGKLTASRMADAIARIKTGWGASRANLMAEKVAERLTGIPHEGYKNDAMQRGNDVEPEARAAYEILTFYTIKQVGFVHHPTIPELGCSPDGLVESNGLVQIKCPFTATHIETLLSESIPGRYMTQMQMEMACTGREWCDFVSYDPHLPARMQLFIKRIHRDKHEIEGLEQEARTFLYELDAKLLALIAKYKEVE